MRELIIMFSKLLKWLGVVFVLLLLVSCFAEDTEESNSVSTSPQVITEQQEKEEKEADYIFIEEPHITHDGYWNHIEGIVQNNTGKDLDYVQVSFTVYDVDGNVLGSAFANANNVKANGTWKFDALITDDNYASFELDEISGW